MRLAYTFCLVRLIDYEVAAFYGECVGEGAVERGLPPAGDALLMQGVEQAVERYGDVGREGEDGYLLTGKCGECALASDGGEGAVVADHDDRGVWALLKKHVVVVH